MFGESREDPIPEHMQPGYLWPYAGDTSSVPFIHQLQGYPAEYLDFVPADGLANLDDDPDKQIGFLFAGNSLLAARWITREQAIQDGLKGRGPRDYPSIGEASALQYRLSRHGARVAITADIHETWGNGRRHRLLAGKGGP